MSSIAAVNAVKFRVTLATTRMRQALELVRQAAAAPGYSGPAVRKSGTASRVADLRIDAAAKASAQAVRAAGSDGATERFLLRFLDHLHDFDNAGHGIGPLDYPDPDNPGRRRRRG
jgi:hypothetical protein